MTLEKVETSLDDYFGWLKEIVADAKKLGLILKPSSMWNRLQKSYAPTAKLPPSNEQMQADIVELTEAVNSAIKPHGMGFNPVRGLFEEGAD